MLFTVWVIFEGDRCPFSFTREGTKTLFANGLVFWCTQWEEADEMCRKGSRRGYRTQSVLSSFLPIETSHGLMV